MNELFRAYEPLVLDFLLDAGAEKTMRENGNCLLKSTPILSYNELRPISQKGAAMSMNTKKCPMCAEEVPAAAPVCPFCGTEFAAAAGPLDKLGATPAAGAPAHRKLKNRTIASAFLFLALTMACIIFPTPTIAPPPPTGTSAPPTATPGIGSTWTRPADGMVMVYVPEGDFTMGSNEGDSDEQPVHTVYLDAYWIDQTEVTNAMFQVFVNDTGYRTDAEKDGYAWVFDPNSASWSGVIGADWSHPRGPSSNLNGLEDHPVVQVSWNDAAAYCEWADPSTGSGQVRLPTEAEWEKAARGTDGRTYPWGNRSPAGSLLNFADVNLNVDWADKDANDGYQFTAPVGSYPNGASPYGALDMAGNVWEWVADWYGETYYSQSPSSNPQGPASGTARVLRGGSWYFDEDLVRSADRYRLDPSGSDFTLGFRCALSP
jgi:formylglycine-generating enzyme required for sulfatase activity